MVASGQTVLVQHSAGVCGSGVQAADCGAELTRRSKANRDAAREVGGDATQSRACTQALPANPRTSEAGRLTQRQDARLYHRAIKERWDIPENVKQDVIAELHEIAINGFEQSSRIAACRAILMAEGQNQRDQISGVDEFARKVLELADRFGIELSDAGASHQTATRAIGGD